MYLRHCQVPLLQCPPHSPLPPTTPLSTHLEAKVSPAGLCLSPRLEPAILPVSQDTAPWEFFRLPKRSTRLQEPVLGYRGPSGGGGTPPQLAFGNLLEDIC